MLVINRNGSNGSRLGLRKLHTKRYQLAADVAVLAASFALAYLMRFDFDVPADELHRGLVQLPYVVLLQLLALILAGVYTFIWRYVGLAEVRGFCAAAWWSSAALLLLRLCLPEAAEEWRVPFSVTLTDTFFAFGGVLAVRVLRRVVYEQFEKRVRGAGHPGGDKKRVLLIGAGRAGMFAARELRSRAAALSLHVEGFVDDEPNKQGSLMQGVRVLGGTADLPRLVEELEIDHVIITVVHATREQFRRILDICEQIPVRVRVIPGLEDILQGRVTFTRIRDVQIEDLLGREPVQLEEAEVRRFLAGKTVMVTGAGGSIGSELARQLARFRPAELLLVERAEFALFEIERELRAAHPELNVVALVGDVGDRGRMRAIFAARRPQLVFHAAAHKHVPMMESNPAEAVKNNVLATHALGEVAGEHDAEVFVLISTDKAVRPTSVMGASKRVAELVIQDLDRRYETRYVAVRFGNVIGSTGSVIPIFREQIRKGGPVTVTHRDMVRYFMTIPEAAQLVLQAGTMGKGGEIFILDMGEPVRILDLAKDTITLSGLRPYEDIDIVFTGVRAGEKLFEELNTADEHAARTYHPKIFTGKIAAYTGEQVCWGLEQLARLAAEGQTEEIYHFLQDFLPEACLTSQRAVALPRLVPELRAAKTQTV